MRFQTAVAALIGVLPSLTFAAPELPVIELTAGMHRIEAEVVNTQETRMRGLMMRQSMPTHRGMLFVFDADARHCMWMKNTLLPLDMLFVDEGGCIVKVQERARPGSLATIAANVPVVLVMEIAGGQAGDLGIAVGDRISRPEADWPHTVGSCSPEAR